MLRILAGAIISLGLSFLTPAMYHAHLSDIMEGFYSNHFDYAAKAYDGEYLLMPSAYTEWYGFRDGVTENYGRKIIAKKGVIQLYGIARQDFLLKRESRYYKLIPTNSPTYFELEEVQHSNVNPVLYLLRYLLIYMFLIIAPIALCAVFNKHVLKVARIWRIGIIAVSATLVTAIVGYVYLRDWWTLFTGWVL